MIALGLVALLALVSAADAQEAPEITSETTGDIQFSAPLGASLEGMIDIERGEPNRMLDGVGWIIGVPSKLLLLDSRADNHDVSAATVDKTRAFLSDKKVEGVMVRVNQYDPIGEWKRLVKNDRVGLGWRATVGAAYTLGYSVLPGRLFGRDWYNPYTDTVHVYSDVPALALEQAAHADEIRNLSHPGFYSAIQMLPLVGIVHEARAKQAVFEYVDKNGTVDEQAEARRVLAPQLGLELGGQAVAFIPQANALASLSGVAVGHVVGRYQASQIEAAEPPPAPVMGPVLPSELR
ncbi:hypothetical protein [Botrimarina mediterranea]|uniref:Uncharacterized protein n=1 Tax=Botrimarina mediterranea TaxID=2528022 RepID=A0A518K4X6_9BACT|nr:hypothetical protein [Botrimarina mediterranea]QDV72850.1 hypothetical protein Spa11_10330 [Botrimarina mediterranea]QDV77422.1 hypothetical protein K2D_10140 [Planctomycetes bacterium K2D]